MPSCSCCKHQFERSKLVEATKRVWCPTWLGSQNGPIDVCEPCAEKFAASEGSWHWGTEADATFASVRFNVPHTNRRYQSIRNTVIARGTKISGCDEEGVYVILGRAWLVATYNVMMLGNLCEVRKRFPALLAG